MGAISGRIEKQGPFVEMTVMPSEERVERLKANGRSFPAPATVRALIDTGASCCVLDHRIIARLGLEATGKIPIHTPTTGSAYEWRETYDACLVLGQDQPEPCVATVEVVGSDLASEGFFALIGWTVLGLCRLHCDGPTRQFTIEF